MFKAACASVLAIAAVSAATAASGPLQVVSKILTEQRVRAADGSTNVVLGAAKKVVPGDKVVFVLQYRNTGAAPLGNIVLDNPVPQGIAYRGPASGSPAPDLSIDGKTWGALADLRVRGAAGLRAATADDITHVRWRVATIAPGAQGQLSFNAILK